MRDMIRMIVEEVVMNNISVMKMMPVRVTGSELIAILAIGAIETIILTALMKDYSVELSGETTEQGVKGSLKLQATRC